MKSYTVNQLARLSGVSVRTLHHYEEIGLLKPAFVGENRYRYYGREELLRLQSILFHRELGIPLKEIARSMAENGFDRLAMLEQHRARLVDSVQRSRQLIRTIDQSIAELKGNEPMNDSDLYKGFSRKEQAEYEDWLVDRYGPSMRESIDDSKAALAAARDDTQRKLIAELAEIESSLADAKRDGAVPADMAVEPLIEQHRNWVGTMWAKECTAVGYAGLADLYLSHDDFRARYEAIEPGFTDWLTQAMKAHAARLDQGNR